MEDLGHLNDLVDQLEQEVLRLDGSGDTSLVHLLFRTLHNLKSATAYAGLATVSATYHELENALDRIRRGQDTWSHVWADRIFSGIDETRAALGSAAGQAVPRPRPDAAPETRSASAVWGFPLTPEQEDAASQAIVEGLGVYRIEKLFCRGLSKETFEGLPVMRNIQELGTFIAMSPDWSGFLSGPEEQVIKILFASHQTAEELSDVFFDPLLEIQPPQPDEEEPAGALKCLVVEDDLTTARALKHILERYGSCTLVETARHAFSCFRKAWEENRPYHLVLLDLRLPDLDGRAILQVIRKYESCQKVPLDQRCMVLINTASEEREDLMESLALEVDGYMIKPISVALLDEKIRVLKQNRRLHQDLP